MKVFGVHGCSTVNAIIGLMPEINQKSLFKLKLQFENHKISILYVKNFLNIRKNQPVNTIGYTRYIFKNSLTIE